MILYRGDSLPDPSKERTRGKTYAEHFCGNGLMAKFADGGTSELIKNRSLLDYILSHVGYEQERSDKLFSYYSPMISFSADEDIATGYFKARAGKKKQFVPCEFYEANHFVFEFNFDADPIPTIPGLYFFTFKTNSVNCREFNEIQLKHGLIKEAEEGDSSLLGNAILNNIVAGIADKDEKTHLAFIFDVFKFVSNQDTSHQKEKLVKKTLERAEKDKEWLLYPCDPMNEGLGVSAKFPMNEHLRVHSYFKSI